MLFSTTNACFLPDIPYPAAALLRDLREGLRYTYRGEEKTLPWHTTFLDLDTLPFVQRAPYDHFGCAWRTGEALGTR